MGEEVTKKVLLPVCRSTSTATNPGSTSHTHAHRIIMLDLLNFMLTDGTVTVTTSEVTSDSACSNIDDKVQGCRSGTIVNDHSFTPAGT